MLAEFSIKFLGRAGIGERCTESRIVVGLSMGDYVYAKCFVIDLGHRDEHSAAGKKRHEFNKHGTSFVAGIGRCNCSNFADGVVSWRNIVRRRARVWGDKVGSVTILLPSGAPRTGLFGPSAQGRLR